MKIVPHQPRVKVDEISQVIGDPHFALNYYPNGLKDVTVGPHSLDLVSVSRFYMNATPKVVVDFEPSPLDAKFWLEEKRKFFFDRGIVYVPVYLTERLTPAQFKKKLDEEKDVLAVGRGVISENRALDAVTVDEVIQFLPPDRTVEDVLKHPTTIKHIDSESLRILHERLKSKRVTGGARENMLKAIKRQVIENLREKVKRGRMGPDLSHLKPAVAAR